MEDPRCILHDDAIEEWFVRVDLREIREIWIRDLCVVYIKSTSETNDLPSGMHICDIEGCDFNAHSYAALLHHQISSKKPGHNVRNMLNFLCVTNPFVWV